MLKHGLIHLKFMSFKVRRDPGDLRGSTKLRREPAFEAVRRGLSGLIMRQQHVLAPFQRFVAAGEQPVRLAGPKNPALWKLMRIAWLKSEKASVTPCSLQ